MTHSFLLRSKLMAAMLGCLLLMVYVAQAQTQTVTGTVRSSTDQQPLPGVSVHVRGANITAVTDGEGAYRLNGAPASGTIEFTYIGYKQASLAIGSRTKVDVTLEPTASSLDQVVVVGYGTQKKVNLTGAVSIVNFDSVLQNRPITNASQALAGKVTGVWVSQNSGRPGSDGAQLRTRGWGTMNNAEPLVIIDGVEGSIDQVNPSDIESVSVLKDAASAAIYGSRAANGVILIATKNGQYNEKTQISLSSYVGVQSLGRRYDIITNSVELMNLWNQAIVNQGGSNLFPDSVISQFKNNSDPYQYPNTNFFDEVFKKAPITEHTLSIRGGSEKTKFFMSFNYLYQDGIIRRTNSDKYNLTLNLESKLNNWLTVGGRVNGMRKIIEGPYDLGRVLYIFANGAYPFLAPYTEDGRFGAVQALNNGNMIVGNRNPLIETANGSTRAENNYSKINAYANIAITNYLTLKTNFSAQYNSDLTDRYNQVLYGYTNTGIQALNLDYLTTLEASRTNLDSYFYDWFNTLNFNKKFGQKHEISAIAGMQVQNTVIKNSFSRTTDPPKEGLTQVDAGTSGIEANGNMNALRVLSYFGRLNYSFSGKYLLEVDIRTDASSRFAQAHRWGVFPGISAGWRLSEEDFIKTMNIFSDLKLRASYGQLGNDNINGYWPYLTTVDQNDDLGYSWGGEIAPGAGVTALTNEAITWETAVNRDVGLDFGFLNNQLTGTIDYFNKLTKDIIVQLPIPLDLGGLVAPFQNIGKMLNKGFEFSVNYAKVAADRDKFGYNLGLNLTYIHNEVTQFQGGKSPDQLYLIREGYSYKTLYGLKSIGIFQTDEEADEYMHANGYKPQAGDLKYEDVNKDGKIGFEDEMDLGNTIPKFTYGANFDFSYKGFNLSMLLQGMGGVHLYTFNAWTQPLGISGGTITKRWKNSWTPQNTNTDIPHIKIPDTWNNQPSSFWVSEASFIKMQNIQFGYTFPNSVITPLGIQGLYVYANAQNVFTLVNNHYEGFDPERNTFDAGENYYPIPRILSFGVNVNF